MKISVNGDPLVIDRASPSVADVLLLKQVEQPEMVSVQLNGMFVDKDLYGTTIVREGDEVEFLYFLGGGRGW